MRPNTKRYVPGQGVNPHVVTRTESSSTGTKREYGFHGRLVHRTRTRIIWVVTDATGAYHSTHHTMAKAKRTAAAMDKRVDRRNAEVK